MKQENIWAGAYEILCRGRIPFAKAELHGNEEYPNVRGSVHFYATPVGVLVHAEVVGLPRGGRNTKRAMAYRFCLQECQENGMARDGYITPPKRYLPCNVLPTVYEKDGTLWCSVLTGRILPADLFGKIMSIHESTGCCPALDQSVRRVASGTVECACVKKIHA